MFVLLKLTVVSFGVWFRLIFKKLSLSLFSSSFVWWELDLIQLKLPLCYRIWHAYFCWFITCDNKIELQEHHKSKSLYKYFMSSQFALLLVKDHVGLLSPFDAMHYGMWNNVSQEKQVTARAQWIEFSAFLCGRNEEFRTWNIGEFGRRSGQSPSQSVILKHSVLLCLSHLWVQVSSVSSGTCVNGHATSFDFKELPSKRLSILVVNHAINF